MTTVERLGQGIQNIGAPAPPPNTMTVRKWHVDTALYSTRSLMQIINELTAEEIEAALKLESESRRRSWIIDRLIGRAARLNELTFVAQLKERYLQCPAKNL